MKAVYINPFLSATYNVIKVIADTEAVKGELSLGSSPIKGDEVNVVIGVTGDLTGQIIFCLSEKTARVLASKMLFALSTDTFGELAKSAIGELGNMIIGNAVTELVDKGLICDLTPPALFIGKDVTVSTASSQFLVIPFEMDLGKLNINVALQETSLVGRNFGEIRKS